MAQTFDDFENGWGNWTLLDSDTDFKQNSYQPYEGSYSGYVYANQTDIHHQAEQSFGEEIEYFSIYYRERDGSQGHAIKLVDSNGDMVTAAGSDNPHWIWIDGNSSGSDSYGGYMEWTQIEFTIDYSNNEANIYIHNTASGNDINRTVGLRSTNKVTEVEFVNVSNESELDSETADYTSLDLYVDDATYTPVSSPPSQPRNASISIDANDQITFNWDDPSDWGNEQGNYRVQMSRDSTSWDYPSGGPSTPGSGSNSETYGPNSDNPYDTQVGIDSSFQFRVRAENSAGNSGWDYSSTKYTDPIPPHNPSVSRPDANTINVSATIQADQPHSVVVKCREDTGSGYGSWNWYDTWYSSEVNMSTGNRITVSYSVGTQYDGGIALQTDSRYQFRLYQRATDTSKHSESVYADYGNNGNVYFSDDFESNDLSAWDYIDQDAFVASGSSMDSGFSSADEGTYYAYLDSNARIQKDLGDLTGESDVIVKCALAGGSLDNSSEYAKLRWYDGSNWQILEQLDWSYNEQGWVEVTALVPDSYLSNNNHVRFDQDGGGGDRTYVDRVVVSDLLHEYTKPAAPSSLSLDNSTEDEITASWTNNADFRSTNYVEFKKSSNSSFNYLFNNGGSTSASDNSNIIPDLLDGEEYDVKIQTKVVQNRNGNQYDGQYRTRSSVSTTTTKLPAPTSLSVSNIGPTTADLSWTDNADNEDAYRVLVEEDGEPTGMDFTASNSDSISINADAGDVGFEGGDKTLFVRLACESFDGGGFFEIGTQSDSNEFSLKTRGSDGDWRFQGYSSGDVDFSYGTAGQVVSLCFTYDDSAGELEVYTDGSSEKVSSNSYNVAADDGIQLGEWSGNYGDGKVYEIAIWDRELSSSEVSDAHNGNIPSNSLRGYWPLDQNNSGTTPDLSEYSNDGTVNGPTIVGSGLTDKSGALGAGTTSYNLSSLLETTTYDAYVQAETGHSVTRDM